MAEKITYRFLPEDKCLTERQLYDYIDQKLNAAEMHLVEKHVLACEMCSDALEGLEKVKHREKVAAFSPAGILNPAPENGIETSQPKVIPLHPNRKYYAIAAGLILIIGVSLYFKMNVSNDMDSAKTADLVQRDSINAMISPPKEINGTNNPPAPVTEDFKQDKSTSRELRGDQQQPGYWNNFGLADSLKQTNEETEESDLKSQEQTVTQNDAAPLQNITPGPVLDETKNIPQDQKEDKDLARAEQKKSEAQSGSDDRFEVNAKTPSKNNDYRNDNNSNKIALEKSKDKAAAHDAPVTQQPASTISAAPSNAGAGSYSTGTVVTGNTYTTTDSETNMTINGDSVKADTPRLYPLPLSASDKDLDLSYQNGVKLLNAGQATSSLVLFDEVLKNPNHHYYQDAQWKKASALIQLNRKAEAKTLLEEIVKKGGRYKSQAAEELKKL